MEFNLNSSEIFRPGTSRFLWAIAALFIVLGLGYSTLTPIFENSDETLHYPYAKHLADGNGLPLAIPNQLWGQEGTQPPLYCAMVAATTFWINADNLAEHLQRNPHWLFTQVRARLNDNQNLVLHGPMDAFPYRRAALAVHIGRWWSLFFGLVAVACTFLIARHFFPTNLPLTISATALAAFTPQFIRVSSTVSNDSLSAALASLTVLLALKFTTPRQGLNPAKNSVPINSPFTIHHSPFTINYLPPILLGLLSGLALLTKLSSLTTAVLAGAIIFWRLFFTGETHDRPFQKMVRWLLIIGAITALLNGWWFVRNYRLYGEWLAVDTHLSLAGGHTPISLSEVWDLRPEIERAYWATLGWGQIRPPEWVFIVLRGFVRVGLIGLGLAVLAKLIQGDKSRPLPLNLRSVTIEQIIFLIFWAGLNLALYLRWAMEVGSVSHTRLIFPAITAISMLLALGWHALLPRRFEAGFSGLLSVGMVALNIYCLGWLIYPAFTPNRQLNPQHTPVELTFLNSLKLHSGDAYPGLTRHPNLSKQHGATGGDTITISARWQGVAPMDKNYSVSAVLLAPDGSALASRQTYPGLGLRPTRYLTPGTQFEDRYSLKIAADVTEPMVARAVVTLFDFKSDARAGFPALDAQGNEVTPLVGRVKIVPQTWPTYRPTSPTDVNFANAITLIGYDLKTQNSKPETFNLYWQSLAPVDEDYILFIHLLDAGGNVVAQADAPPTRNVYPTSWWAPGETIAGTHALPSAPGTVRLRLGLYSPTSGHRLPIIESNLPVQDDGVEIELK